jgi:hypothetical protein
MRFSKQKVKVIGKKMVSPFRGAEHNRDFNAAATIKSESVRPARPEFMPVEDYLFKRNRRFSSQTA